MAGFLLYCLLTLVHFTVFLLKWTYMTSCAWWWSQKLRKDLCVIGFYLDHWYRISSVQFISVTQSCLTLCDPMNCSTPGLPFHHQPLESTQTHVHQVSYAIQPSHPMLSPSPPVPNPSQHQGLFQWVNSSHEVAKVLEFQTQHQSFLWYSGI